MGLLVPEFDEQDIFHSERIVGSLWLSFRDVVARSDLFVPRETGENLDSFG